MVKKRSMFAPSPEVTDMEDLTTSLYRRAEQGRASGTQALYWRRIWEIISAAPSGSCLKNALENK